MLAFTTLDVVTVIGALSAALVSIISAIFAGLNRRALKMPSGGTIGERVEQTSHLSAAIVAHTTDLLNGQAEAAAATKPAPPPEPLPGETPPPA